jgi:O-antigen ligase
MARDSFAALRLDARTWGLIAAVSVGFVAAGATLVAASQLKYLLGLLITWLVTAIFLASGNLRLACLYTIILLAPLRLGKPFMVISHMGGAGAFWIDAIDPMMLALIFFQLRDVREHRREEYRISRSAIYWALMIVLGVGSILLAPFHMTAAEETVRMAKLLMLFLVIVNEVVRRRQFNHAAVALMIGVFANSSIAIAQYVTGLQFGLDFLGEGSREGLEAVGSVTLSSREFVYRPGGLMGAGNLFAAYLALLLPVAIGMALAPVGRLLKLFLVVTIILGQSALILTLSRTAWIAFGFSFVSVLVLGMWNPVSRRRYLAARVAIVATTVIVGVGFTPLIMQRIYGSDPNAFKVRLEWLRVARAMVFDKPVFGVGLNNYVFVQPPYGANKTPDEMTARYGALWPVVHSTWAVTWAEQGTVGFLLFVALHISIIRAGWRNLSIRDPVLHAMSAGLLSGFFAIMIDGLSSFFLRMDQHARVWWVVTALIVALGYWREANEASGRTRPAAAPVPEKPVDPLGSRREGGWLPAPSRGFPRLGGPQAGATWAGRRTR